MPTLRALLPLLLLLELLFAATGHVAEARPARRYTIEGNELPVALLTAGRATYLVTEHSVFELAGKRFVRRYQSPAPIQCALHADTALWLGTTQGLVALGTTEFRARPVALPVPEATPGITALFADATHTVWAGVRGYGAFRLVQGRFEPALNIPSVNSGIATADSSVWIATNIGLNRLQHQQWIRYNEEGVANHEIPDNIVDKLLLDNSGNLWVLMSDGISVFAGGAELPDHDAHPPTVTFIGRHGNAVYSVAHVPRAGFVFATAMGPLLLPEQPTDVLGSLEPAPTDKVEQKQLLVPLPGLGAAPPRLILLDQKQRVWLVATGAVQVLSSKEFRRLLQAAPRSRPLQG